MMFITEALLLGLFATVLGALLGAGIRIFDEVEKGDRTTIAIQEADLSSLPLNIFTKASLESKTR